MVKFLSTIMEKIVPVLGACPQLVKTAAVSREINKYEELEETFIHTGQHFDFSNNY